MLATVASITSANRLKRCGEEYGFHSSVIQTPHSLAKEGCGYSVRFDDSNKNDFKNCAYTLNIKIRAFYRESEKNGKSIYFKE